MTLVGFNAQQIATGCGRRGDSRRRLKRKQGPLCAQCLAQNISALPTAQMEAFFNGVIRRLVALRRPASLDRLGGARKPGQIGELITQSGTLTLCAGRSGADAI